MTLSFLFCLSCCFSFGLLFILVRHYFICQLKPLCSCIIESHKKLIQSTSRFESSYLHQIQFCSLTQSGSQRCFRFINKSVQVTLIKFSFDIVFELFSLDNNNVRLTIRFELKSSVALFQFYYLVSCKWEKCCLHKILSGFV